MKPNSLVLYMTRSSAHLLRCDDTIDAQYRNSTAKKTCVVRFPIFHSRTKSPKIRERTAEGGKAMDPVAESIQLSSDPFCGSGAKGHPTPLSGLEFSPTPDLKPICGGALLIVARGSGCAQHVVRTSLHSARVSLRTVQRSRDTRASPD